VEYRSKINQNQTFPVDGMAVAYSLAFAVPIARRLNAGMMAIFHDPECWGTLSPHLHFLGDPDRQNRCFRLTATAGSVTSPSAPNSSGHGRDCRRLAHQGTSHKVRPDIRSATYRDTLPKKNAVSIPLLPRTTVP
jgi:hypothetical protein